MPSTPVTLELHRSPAKVSALEAEWTRLYEESENKNPFLSFDWTLACWATRERSAELFVATAREKGRLVGVAPLCIETRAGFRMLRFIADERSDYLGFLASPEVERRLLDEIAAMKGEWDLVLLQKLTPSYSSLLEGELSENHSWHRTRWTSAPYCLAEGDWDSFHRDGPIWLREARRRTRRYFKDGYTAECFTGTEAAKRVPLVSQVEARSWKAKEGATRLQPGPGADLLRRGFETLGSRGEMELWLGFVGERAVAYHIYFVLPGRLWHYHTGYEEEYRNTRAGSIVAYLAIQSAWDRGIREFDYLSGEEPYKLERSNAARGIYHLAGHRRTPRGWLAYALLIAPRWRLRNIAALRKLHDAVRSLARRAKGHGRG
jgi:CelD/BcsL family acetyltransferase involved in cellulose biosynthesis